MHRNIAAMLFKCCVPTEFQLVTIRFFLIVFLSPFSFFYALCSFLIILLAPGFFLLLHTVLRGGEFFSALLQKVGKWENALCCKMELESFFLNKIRISQLIINCSKLRSAKKQPFLSSLVITL